MPELPEVETVRLGLQPHVEGQIISKVHVERYDLRRPVPYDLGQRITQRRVVELSRRGKVLLWHLDDGGVILIHLGMSGRLGIVSASTLPIRHDHVRVELASGDQVVLHDPRRFGFFDYCQRDDLVLDPLLSRLGPEPLEPAFDATCLAKQLAGRSGPIKNVLLDQAVVAGLGNIYVCEALFRAGISPMRAAKTVPHQGLVVLVDAIKEVLAHAVAVGGSTLKDHRKPDGSQGYFQMQFKVYDREGQPCPLHPDAKKHGIQRIVQSGRSTYYCPACQR